ncbi:MAG: hypothetical protein ABR581_05520 [Thermoleophilaceae bacterium]
MTARKLSAPLGLAALAAAAVASPTQAGGTDAAAHRPVLLATGDSMIQIVDTKIAQRLRRGHHRIRVRSDARVSTGISKPFLLDWRRHARHQVGRYHQRATVVFIGANDGFDMRTPSGAKAACCGAAWVGEYARRARRMMITYARKGRAHVYWLLLPQARGGFFRKVYPRVNAALRQAASSLRQVSLLKGKVQLIHLNRVFTPHGHYRAVMRWRGHLRRVRQGDGIHLSTAGAAIAAFYVAHALRGDRLIR